MSPRPADTRRLVGRYRLDSELGRGAMGTVWSAYDEVLHRPVAVKEVRLSLVPVSERAVVRERTLREARATAMLSHPNVVTLYDVVEVNAEPYVVMELLPSRSLASYIGERGTLSPAETAEIGSAVASALMTAHRAGITHRDVKPGNVLIGTDGQIKLTDFGIARNAAESSMTQTGTVLGSPPYIAPEVAMGRAVGPPADLWGLGATLYACLEGRPPYDAGDPVSTVSAVVHGDVPRPGGHGPVQDVIRGLMVKDPTLRMPLPAVRRRLRPLMADPEGPVLSAPPSPATTEFRLPSAPARPDPADHSGLIPVARGRSGTLVDGQVPPARPGGTPRTAPLRAPGRSVPDDGSEGSGPSTATGSGDTGDAPAEGAGGVATVAGGVAAAGAAAAAAGVAAEESSGTPGEAAEVPADSPGTSAADPDAAVAADGAGGQQTSTGTAPAADEDADDDADADDADEAPTGTADGDAPPEDAAAPARTGADATPAATSPESAAPAPTAATGDAGTSAAPAETDTASEDEPAAATGTTDEGGETATEASGDATSDAEPGGSAGKTDGTDDDPSAIDPDDDPSADGPSADAASGGDVPAATGPDPADEASDDATATPDAAAASPTGSADTDGSEGADGTDEAADADGTDAAAGPSGGAAAAPSGRDGGRTELVAGTAAAASRIGTSGDDADDTSNGTPDQDPPGTTDDADTPGSDASDRPDPTSGRTGTPAGGVPTGPRTGTPPGGTRTTTPSGGTPRSTPSGGTPVPAPSAAETTMVTPRVPPRRGPTTPGPWPAPGPPQRRPPYPNAPGGPRRPGGPQALASDPGPLPFAPSRSGGTSPQQQQRRRRAAVVALVVVLALAGLLGGYVVTRLIGGQAPFSISLSPAGQVVDGEQLVVHADDNARYSGTGMGFTALVPATWQQFRLQQPGGDIVVRYVSDDANRELRIDKLIGFYPAQTVADYTRLLADPTKVGADGVRLEPVTQVAPARTGAREPVQQTVYRTQSGPAGALDDRTTWTRLVPSGTDLWVVRMTAPSLAAGGTAAQFAAVADSFAPPV